MQNYLILRNICINRNIVECKAGLYTGISTCADVLIETLWNVKIYFTQFSAKVILVLIETLWNVKSEKVSKFLRFALGINRNIVECKVIFSQRYNWKAKPY